MNAPLGIIWLLPLMLKDMLIIGNIEYMMGEIDDNGHLTNFNSKNLNRQNFGAAPLDTPRCMKCKFLPIRNRGSLFNVNEFADKNVSYHACPGALPYKSRT